MIIAAGSLAGMKEGKLVDPQGFYRTLGLKVQPTVPALTALVQEKIRLEDLERCARAGSCVTYF
ncbi:MAG: hypothetical protein ACLRZ6_03580 [Lachnospiraceae bacterium]